MKIPAFAGIRFFEQAHEEVRADFQFFPDVLAIFVNRVHCAFDLFHVCSFRHSLHFMPCQLQQTNYCVQ